MALLWLAIVSVMAMSYMATAQTIPQLVPGFMATPGFTVSTDITTLTTSGQFVTVSSVSGSSNLWPIWDLYGQHKFSLQDGVPADFHFSKYIIMETNNYGSG